MKLEDEESDNVEDRRGEGGGGGFSFGGRGIGIGSIAIALVASYFLGINPMTVLNILSGGGQSVAPTQQSDQTQSAARAPMASDPMKHLVALVLRDTEKTWTELFKQDGATYIKPRLVVFTGGTQTACGPGLTASGPFYCPGDQKVYIDLDFYQLMKQKFHVAGDFAQAYVIAHEVGHYVQNLLGIMDKVDKARQRSSEVQSNALSVRLELQADCFAGVWAFHANEARSILEAGDVEEALNAANAIGDDALQRQARGEVVPDSFTHGSSAQRSRWFKRGLDSGKVSDCNTFDARQL